QAAMARMDPDFKASNYRLFRRVLGPSLEEIQVFQLWPWKQLGRISRDSAKQELDTYRYPARHCYFNDDGRWLALSTVTRAVVGREHTEIWEIGSGKLCGTLEGNFVCFSPSARYVITHDKSGTSHIWQTADGKLVRKVSKPANESRDSWRPFKKVEDEQAL